jgi:anti-sigma regulatory factor (Ser/Thr protein kinase)
VRQWAIEQGFGLVDQTKIVTAASELARNTVVHGAGGARRLMNEFQISSVPGEGTTVTAVRWR